MIKIYRPVRTNVITQGFGIEKTSPRMLSIYQGMGLKAHNGIDFACWGREPIYHSGNFDGKVKTEVDMRGGIGIDIISCTPLENGNHYKLRYWHLKEVAVYDGQIIKMGELIGWGDNTGMSTGNHLHFGLKPCSKEGEPIYWDNEYCGAIDLEPYFENKFVVDELEEIKTKICELQKTIEIIRSKIIELKYILTKKLN